MGRWDRYDDREDFWRDMVIVQFHPDFRDLPMTDALAKLYQYRRDRRREATEAKLNPTDTDD